MTVGLGSVSGDPADAVHPMVASADPDVVHWIDRLVVLDQDESVIALRDLSADEPAPATLFFLIPQGTTALTPYEHCNKHGLFRGDTVVLEAGSAFPGAGPTCAFRTCGATADAAGALVSADATDEEPAADDGLGCASLAAEAWRRQGAVFAQADAWDGAQDIKHKPWMGLRGARAWVVVGAGAVPGADAGAPIHPMAADPVHFIGLIWAVDQAGAIVALRQLSPDEAAPAALSFDVPIGTTQLTAYECAGRRSERGGARRRCLAEAGGSLGLGLLS